MMSNLAEKIESILGNDARSTRDVRQIVGSVCTEDPKQENQHKTSSLQVFINQFGRVLKQLFLFVLALPLIILYYFTLVGSLALVFLQGKQYPQREFKLRSEVFNKLFKHWGKYPLHFIIKALESELFSNETVESPSLEIGCYSGDTSEALYVGKQLDFGMEYVPSNLGKYLEKGPTVFSNLLCGDIYDIPFSNQSIKSLFIVHSLDDIQRGIDGALSECNRILIPGGKVCFSLYSHRFLDNNLFVRILRLMGLKNLASRLFSLMFVGTHNCYSLEQWKDILSKYQLNIEKHVYFLPTTTGRLIDLPFRLEGVLINLLGCQWFMWPLTCCSLISSIYQRILWKLLFSVYRTSYDSTGSNKEGINLFIIARKEGKPGLVTCPHPFYVCPACKSKVLKTELSDKKQEYCCQECSATYPLWKGLPLLLKSVSASQ